MAKSANVENNAPATGPDQTIDLVEDVLVQVVLPAWTNSGLVASPSNWRIDTQVAIASYRRDFDDLWQFSKKLCRWFAKAQLKRPRTLILIWDGGVPDGGHGSGLAAKYVTATDWAIACALHVNADGEEQPTWRIVVLDLSPVKATPSLTSRLFPLAQPLLPIVSVFRPTSPADLTGLLEVLTAPIPKTSSRDRDLVKRLWASAIMKPDDLQERHSITNLVGVRLLLHTMQGQQATYQRNGGPVAALEQLMSALGLTPKNDDDFEGAAAPWFPANEWRHLVDRFVLIDDMANLGWAECVRRALDIPNAPGDQAGQKRLRVFSDPEDSGFGAQRDTSLCTLIASEQNKLKVNSNASLTGCENEVLFLDLRLFAGTASRNERMFIKRLLPLAESVPSARRDLPWPGFQRKELDAVHHYLNTGVPNENYFTALTLLPRLIALACPQLPIVLFSSTGQRAIIRAFADYGSIITEFDKPRFFGEVPGTVAADTADRFNRAMSRAIRILRGRRLCHALTVVEAPPAVADAIKIPQPTTPPPKKYVEIYIDESGSGRQVIVGGLAVVYPSETVAASLSGALRAAGVACGFDEDGGATIPTPHLHKRLRKRSNEAAEHYAERERRYVDKNLADLARIAGQDVTFHAFRLKPPRHLAGRHRDRQSLANHLYRSLLESALEALLFMWPLTRCKDVNVAIYVATKIQVGDHHEMQKLRAQWGYDFTEHGPKWRAYTFSSQEVLPIVEAIRTHRYRDDTVVVARAVQLAYYDDRRRPEEYRLPRQIHYAGDWVVSYPECVPTNWWINGFHETLDKDWEHILQASRRAEMAEGHVDALIEWAQVQPTRTSDPSSVARWVREDLRPCVAELDGESFTRLCKRLR